ncbi:hypothetical protein [Arthrobacter sp. RCC_34]|uniref:hypothetical protein n=1 Tax=Arthrobacter sp. RCC_34 TaxID=3239230 RepID=UPI003524E67C
MLMNVVDRMGAQILRFRSASIPVQSARALLAAATLSVVLFTPWEQLTPEIAGIGRPTYCKPPVNLGLYCLDSTPDKSFAPWIASGVLILVTLGVVPALSSLLHAWVAFSISVGIGLPDGGEQVAQLVSGLVFLMSIDDWAWCAWVPNRGEVFNTARLSRYSAGIRWAGWLGLRLQMAYIYLDSGISKLSHEDWLNGSAMYYFVRDPSFGGSGIVGEVARWASSFDLGVAVLTWAPILIEIMIAVFLLGGPQRRKAAFVTSVLLHAGIIAVIGLWSFSLIMIAAVALAAFPGFRPTPVSDTQELERKEYAAIA